MNRRQVMASLLCSAAYPYLTAEAGAPGQYNETFRPQVHFSPAKNWTNDPNGLVYHNGQYHLFFQHNPFDNKWGHMSWGHAVSPDLLHWKELAVAIPEDDHAMIFSGSIVVDHDNTSGFGSTGPLVAIYTGHTPVRQTQQIAYSLDDGMTWTKYSGNPVLDLNLKEFRDPKVIWYEPEKKWLMVVAKAEERKVQFYKSPDLKAWTLSGEFGPAGVVDGVWECPDLFVLPVENRAGDSKWVLKVDSSPIKPGSGCGGQVFIGTFDGHTFIADSLESQSLDMGEDYYASASWAHLPREQKRHVAIGWMSNPRYAQDTPTSPWRGAMSLPRELALRAQDAGYKLVQRPLRELVSLQSHKSHQTNIRPGTSGKILLTVGRQDSAHRISAVVKPSKGFALVIDQTTSIRIEFAAGRLSVARSGPIPTFVSHNSAPLDARNGLLSLDVVIDRSSVEVFANDGELTICEQMFPNDGAYTVSIEGKDDTVEFPQVDIWKLKSIWQ